jgi:arsenite methyltransferase
MDGTTTPATPATAASTGADDSDADSAERIHGDVRSRYAQAALAVLQAPTGNRGGCCGGASTSAADPRLAAAAFEDCCATEDVKFGPALYDALQLDALPEAATLASLGCGNPTAVADLRPGETVLDLGSGGGIDVLLSAKRVGPTGRAIGIDMTDEMLALARQNAAEAGATNVEFVKGTIEEMPVPDGSVDVIISNCVINLAADKSAVFAEMARVLRPGGRVGVSDVVAANGLSLAERLERGSWSGCIAGALTYEEYEAGLRGAGFDDVRIATTRDVADGMSAAIIQATKPAR